MMARELKPFSKGEKCPAWVNFVYDFKSAKLQAEATKKNNIEKMGLIKKVRSSLTKSEKAVGVKAKGALNIESQLLAGKAFFEYQSALKKITAASTSRLVAYKMAAEMYSEDPATGKSPFYTAQNAISKLKTALITPKTDSKMIWKLVTGPLDFSHEFILRESACYLQSQWEKEVLLEVQDVSDQKNMAQLVMGEGGFAKKFIKGPAEPFLSRSLKKGYYAKKIMGRNIDFENYFLSYLIKGVKSAKPIKGTYSVLIRAYPTGANKYALIRPHATSLELQCATETPQLINLNYPVSKTFNWSPQTCGDVIFKIEVGDLVLTKKYTGYQAFPKFIKDFERGHRTFYIREFPGDEPALKRMGIKFITVKYQFKGHRPVLKLLRSAPGRIPRSIAKCWD